MAERPATIQALFEAMPDFANESALQGVTKTVQFVVTGEDAGHYYLRVADGAVTTHEGVAESPDATITTPSDVWMQVATGQLNGAVAFMMGQFKATGDIGLLMSMQSWFNLPS